MRDTFGAHSLKTNPPEFNAVKNFVFLSSQIEENLGMAMVFTLVSATQEFLNNKVDEDKKLQTEEQRKKEEAEDRAREEEVWK